MATNSYYTTRAQAAYAAAEATPDPRDKAAFRAAAHAWEKLARPPTEDTFSMAPYRLQMAALKRDAAEATVETPVITKPVVPQREAIEDFFCTRTQPVTIEF